MMQIDATFIKKYGKICDRLRDANQPVFDSILLNFGEQTATFGSQRGFGQIKMPVEGYDGTQEPFMVNLANFLAVIRDFPVLELEGFKFKSGADAEFEISHMKDEFDYPPFLSTPNVKRYTFDKDVISSIKKAGQYTEDAGSASLNGIFITEGSVFGLTRSRMFEEKIASLVGADINLPRSVWETLALEVLSEDLVIDVDDAQFFISSGDEIKIQLALSSMLQLPPVKSPTFISKYDHSTFVTVDKDSLVNVVNFMSQFVQNAPSNRMQLIFTQTELELKTEEQNSSRISRKIALKSAPPNSFKGEKIWASNTWIKTILSTLVGSVVKIQVNPAQPALNFSTEENPTTHIVYSRLSETV